MFRRELRKKCWIVLLEIVSFTVFFLFVIAKVGIFCCCWHGS